jgi:sugar phosphate isomerase/epimerase
MGTPHLTALDAIDFFSRIRYDAVELICDPYYACSITHLAPRELRRELRSRALATGVAIGCLTPYVNDLAVPDPRIQATAVETLRRYVDLAVDLGCPNVRVLAGREVPAVDRPAYLPRLVESLRQVAEVAGSATVSLVIENHMDTMAITARETVEILQAVNHSAMGIIYDQGNLLFSNAEGPKEAIDLQGPYIRHVHVKDHIFRDGRKAVRVLGEGEIPWGEILGLLQGFGYNAYYCVEYEMRWSRPNTIPPPEVAFVESARVLRGLFSRGANVA